MQHRLKDIKTPLLLGILSVIVGVVCYAFPEIDLWASGLFFDGSHFFLSRHPILLMLHKSVKILTISLVILYIGLLVKSYLWRDLRLPIEISRKQIIYLMVALILGPGLVVNTLFKDHWGRARPSQVEQFNGSHTFSPAFVITDQCERNCSFVSGDPSVGFYLISFVFLSGRKRLLWLPMSIGSLYGATRLIQGAHFLSDVILSAIFTMWLCYGLYWLMFCRKPKELT